MKDIELGTWKTEFITDKVAWNQGFGAGRFWDGSGSGRLRLRNPAWNNKYKKVQSVGMQLLPIKSLFLITKANNLLPLTR